MNELSIMPIRAQYADETANGVNIDEALAAATSELEALETAVAGKQDKLTFDNAPTQDSDNPVKSGGIYTALSGKQGALTTTSVEDGTPVSLIGFNSDGDVVKSPLSSGTIADALGLDSSGNIVKGAISGGTQLYKHTIKINAPSIPPTSTLRLIVITNSNTPYTKSALINDFINDSSIISAFFNVYSNLYRNSIIGLELVENLESSYYVIRASTGNNFVLDDTTSIESDTVSLL